MKISIVTILSVFVALSVVSCIIGGPAYPEESGRAYLEKLGYSSDLISKLIGGEKLEPPIVRELQASKSSDVRFLIARNPNLTHEQIAISIAHKDDFTRSGAAHNTNLSSSQIELLTDDASHTVYATLAGNTALSDEQLLGIQEKRNPGGLWFAMNPNCPESIRRSIISSNDSLAKRWLEITNERKKNGTYKQNIKGRWFKP